MEDKQMEFNPLEIKLLKLGRFGDIPMRLLYHLPIFEQYPEKHHNLQTVIDWLLDFKFTISSHYDENATAYNANSIRNVVLYDQLHLSYKYISFIIAKTIDIDSDVFGKPEMKINDLQKHLSKCSLHYKFKNKRQANTFANELSIINPYRKILHVLMLKYSIAFTLFHEISHHLWGHFTNETKLYYDSDISDYNLDIENKGKAFLSWWKEFDCDIMAMVFMPMFSKIDEIYLDTEWRPRNISMPERVLMNLLRDPYILYRENAKDLVDSLVNEQDETQNNPEYIRKVCIYTQNDPLIGGLISFLPFLIHKYYNQKHDEVIGTHPPIVNRIIAIITRSLRIDKISDGPTKVSQWIIDNVLTKFLSKTTMYAKEYIEWNTKNHDEAHRYFRNRSKRYNNFDPEIAYSFLPKTH